MNDGLRAAPDPAAPFPGPLAALLLTFGGILATALAAAAVMPLFGSQITPAAIGVGEAVGLGAVATWAARRVAPPQRERLGLVGFELRFLPMIAMLVPLAIVLSEIDNLIRAWVPVSDPAAVAQALRDAQQKLRGASLLVAVETGIVAVGIAPVVEEWLFRGVLQQGLVARLSRVRGVLLAAALFAVVHVGPAPSAAGALSPLVYSLALGAVLGTLRIATGSILAPMLLSGAVSGLGLLATRFAASVPIAGFNTMDAHTSAAVLLPSLFAVCWALTLLLRAAALAPELAPGSSEPLELEPRDDGE